MFLLRWKPPVTDQTEYEELKKNDQTDLIGGLEIFLNLEKVNIFLYHYLFHKIKNLSKWLFIKRSLFMIFV